MSIRTHAIKLGNGFDENSYKISRMLKMLFRGLLEVSSTYYGDAIGLAPISMATSKKKQNSDAELFWMKDCRDHPTRIACLNYES